MKKRAVLVTFLVLIIMITGCKSNQDIKGDQNLQEEQKAGAANVDNGTAKDNTDSVKLVDEEVLVDQSKEIVLAGTRNIAPGEKDAYYCSSALMVWEPLITKGSDYGPKPKLAASYSANEDYTVWTFKLREGVSFHDGEVFNADAVIANFNRMKLGKKSSSFYGMDVNRTYPGLLEVNKKDDYTIELVFENPLPTLDYSMTDFGSAMFSPNNFDEEGNFNGFPMGTGPFKLTENVLDEYCVIEKNNDYYGEKALAKRIKIKVIPSPDTRFAALKAEEVMGVIDLGAIQPVMAMELIKDNRFGISHTPSTITHYILLNGNKEPFNDLRLRQAVSLLIDRQLIIDSFYAGLGEPTVNVLNACTPFYKEFEIEQDVKKAKELAKEILGDERVKVSFVLRQGELDRYPNKEEAQLLQAQLSELGIDAEITILESSAWNDVVKAGDFDISLKIKGLSSAEPNTLFKTMMKTENGLNKRWNFGYSNKEVDTLITDVENEIDMDKRKEIYNKIQAYSVNEFPAVPYFNDVNLIAYNKKIEGYEAMYYGVSLEKTKWAD
ncbi:ABC transporter substrate-binding protein [Vallitalea sediminicola]